MTLQVEYLIFINIGYLGDDGRKYNARYMPLCKFYMNQAEWCFDNGDIVALSRNSM